MCTQAQRRPEALVFTLFVYPPNRVSFSVLFWSNSAVNYEIHHPLIPLECERGVVSKVAKEKKELLARCQGQSTSGLENP